MTAPSPILRGVPYITQIDPLGGYRLGLTFVDGVRHDIDFSDLLNSSDFYYDLRDPAKFAAVFVDPGSGGLLWPDGTRLDPWTLHRWPDVGHNRVRAAEKATRVAKRMRKFWWAVLGFWAIFLGLQVAAWAGVDPLALEPRPADLMFATGNVLLWSMYAHDNVLKPTWRHWLMMLAAMALVLGSLFAR